MKHILALAALSLIFVGCKNQLTTDPDGPPAGEETDTLIHTLPEDTLVAPLSTDPVFLLDQIHNSVVSFDFYASFTEPFRTIYFIDTLVLINSADDGPMIYTAATSFDPALPSQTLTFLMDGVNWDALITQGLGSDGMSEIEYPYAVILNSNFHGGGGEEYVQMQ